jgi:hypothetical protein
LECDEAHRCSDSARCRSADTGGRETDRYTHDEGHGNRVLSTASLVCHGNRLIDRGKEHSNKNDPQDGGASCILITEKKSHQLVRKDKNRSKNQENDY